MTIVEFGRQLRAGKISAAEIVERCLANIDKDGARLNAFILVMADEARRQAQDADREIAAGKDRGPLHGVPISVKDLIDIQGTPTTAASKVRANCIAERTAPAITHLRHAGAVIVGKTNLHEFALGVTNEESAYGPVRNPRDETRSPGGSSGGSAASVAAGMALASIGSDTGGSIRIPAAACGIVGLKPTYREVSTEGVIPLSRSLDHVGPLAASVGDAHLVYHALMGDFAPRPLADRSMKELRFAVPRAYFCDVLDEEVRAAFEGALARFRAAGAAVEDVTIGHAKDIGPIYLHLGLAEAAAYHAKTIEAMPERYTDGVRLRLEIGRHITAEDYVRAARGREVLRREVDEALEGGRTLALPTLPIPAPTLGANSVEIGAKREPVRNLLLRLTQIFNITGHPAISLPCGQTASGLPCALQLVGTRGETDALLAAAAACERGLSLR